MQVDATEMLPGWRRAYEAIWSLLAEPDGTVWAGTFRGGLLRFRDGKFTRFSINEGLLDNVICQICNVRLGISAELADAILVEPLHKEEQVA